jgi:hypothetical protein
MANAVSQYPPPTEWKALYRAAVLEANSSEMMKRVSNAEAAIVQRMCELFRETGTNAEGEREAMDDATYALRALKTALELKTRAA